MASGDVGFGEWARGGGFSAFAIASSHFPVRRRRRRFLFQGKGGFVPVLLFSRITAQLISRPDQRPRLPGFSRTQFGEDAVKVIARFARQVVFHLPKLFKKRIRFHKGDRGLLPIAGHDPIAQDLVRGLHRIGVDDEFLLARVLGDQFQAKLEILESLRA